MIKILLSILLLHIGFSSCNENRQPNPNDPFIQKDTIVIKEISLRTMLEHYPYVTGNSRNGIQAMEGVDFSSNKLDSNKFDYRFSIVNWRDKFNDVKGTVYIDSSTLKNDFFFIKDVNDTTDIAAIKLVDDRKHQPIIIGMSKDYTLLRIFEHKKGKLKELSRILYAK